MRVDLPRLRYLCIGLARAEDILKLLVEIEAPNLEQLNVQAYDRSNYYPPQPLGRKRFDSLRVLRVESPATSVLPLFELLPMEQITDLILLPMMEPESSGHVQRRTQLTAPIKLSGLRNLQFSMSKFPNDRAPVDWFYSVFDWDGTICRFHSVGIERRCKSLQLCGTHWLGGFCKGRRSYSFRRCGRVRFCGIYKRWPWNCHF